MAFDTGNTVELAAGNGDGIQLFGPATATSSSTATTAPGSSRCWRWTTWIRRAPSWPVTVLSCSAGRSQTAPGPWLTFRMPDGNIHSLGARMA